MTRSGFFRCVLAACSTALLPPLVHAQAEPPKRKPDLADAAEGTYFGDVISDSKGESKSDVTLTVTRVGANRVRVSSDYARLPTVEVTLTRAMDKILNASGATTFLLDRRKTETRLDVGFMSEVSWSGTKR